MVKDLEKKVKIFRIGKIGDEGWLYIIDRTFDFTSQAVFTVKKAKIIGEGLPVHYVLFCGLEYVGSVIDPEKADEIIRQYVKTRASALSVPDNPENKPYKIIDETI